MSDWGQKNVGSFTTKAFMDYYDYTQNKTFLRETLYPLAKLNGEFYASYMTKIGGKYNVLHSCAMEGCGAQGPDTSANTVVSNNPPFDLAFVKRTFRELLEYSTTLGVDSESRAQWRDLLENVADYPLTKDEHGETVFAQATLNAGPTSTDTDGFPNASSCVWEKVVPSEPQATCGTDCRSHCSGSALPLPKQGCRYPCSSGSTTCCAPCPADEGEDEPAFMQQVEASPPWSCELFGCSCQGMSDYYGVVAGDGFGCTPPEAQAFWAAHKCRTKAKAGNCGGPACKLPGAAECVAVKT